MITVLLIIVSGLSVFMGQLVAYGAKSEPWLSGWEIVFYIVAAVVALFALINLIYDVVRRVHRRENARRAYAIKYNRKRKRR